MRAKRPKSPPPSSALEKLLPGYWEEQRRPLTPSDRALTGKAIDWLMALPAIARPKALSEQYPRIANHLAEHWSDLACTQLALMRLLADERGGRKGFSLQIEQEIEPPGRSRAVAARKRAHRTRCAVVLRAHRA